MTQARCWSRQATSCTWKGATDQVSLTMLGAKADTISMTPSGKRSSNRRRRIAEKATKSKNPVYPRGRPTASARAMMACTSSSLTSAMHSPASVIAISISTDAAAKSSDLKSSASSSGNWAGGGSGGAGSSGGSESSIASSSSAAAGARFVGARSTGAPSRNTRQWADGGGN